jgi:hypothetical protein
MKNLEALQNIIRFIMFNATFSNISAISWRPVLMVEEAGVNWKEPLIMGKKLVNLITCDSESSAPFFVIYKAGCESLPVLVMGLYELLGNPTTKLIEPPRPFTKYNSQNFFTGKI